MNILPRLIFLCLFTFFFNVSKGQLPQEWPYELGKPLDSRFYDQIKDMEVKESISNKFGFTTLKLYFNNENNFPKEMLDEEYEDIEQEHDAIIQINGYYYQFKLAMKLENGKYYNMKILDIAGIEKRNEIIIETGCYSPAGCLNETLVIFNHKSGPISIIKLGMTESYQKLSSGEVIIKNEMMWSEGSYNCHSVSQSYKLSKYSIVKTKTFFKKRKVECVG